MPGKVLILATAHTAAAARPAIARGLMPRIDYLDLQEQLNADLIDHSIYQPPWLQHWRTAENSLRMHWAQAIYALRQWRDYEVVYSLSEDIGLPLAVLLRAWRPPAETRPHHIMVAHSVLSRRKRCLIGALGGISDIGRIVTLTETTAQQLRARYQLPAAQVTALLDGVDEQFWQPQPQVAVEPNLVLSLGRARRDYAGVIAAVRGLPLQLHIQASSQWCVRYVNQMGALPSNVQVGDYLSFVQLRHLYARARLVVVALQPDSHHSAGTVTIKEAMAMGKAVIVAAAGGMEDYVEHGVTGLITPAGDVAALRAAIRQLLADPQRCAEMGRAGRAAIEQRMSYDRKITALAQLARRPALQPLSLPAPALPLNKPAELQICPSSLVSKPPPAQTHQGMIANV